MAKLYFHYATMNAGKSAYLLQANHNYTSQGMRTILLSPSIDTRSGEGQISSRIGIDAPCIKLMPDDDPFDVVFPQALKSDSALRCVFVDEAQFLSASQVVSLARIVDELSTPVMCFGLRTDFKGNLFEGSERLFCLADEIREIRAVCWCGKRATMVLRTDQNGQVVKEGESVQVGGDDMYKSVCRKHWVEQKTGHNHKNG